eukprot:m.26553 g.26553  ORF g.26553 m.26553 type:complete len:605 (-) comp8945_c0_seq1:26-1840(-)
MFEREHLLPALLAAVLAAGLSLSSLHGNFVFDDMPAIKNNPDVDPAQTSVFHLFGDNFWGQPMGSPQAQHHSYRPFTTLTFRWNVIVSGFDPTSFHVVNVVLHALATLLFTVTCRVLCARCAVGGTTIPAAVGTLAGLLFAVHPVHTEAVSNIVCRAELLSCIFFLLSFFVYMQCCDAKAPLRMLVLAAGSYALTFAGLLCKEQGITSVVVCAVYDALIATDIDPRSILGLDKPSSTSKSSTADSIPRKPRRAGPASSAFTPATFKFLLRQATLGLFLAVVVMWRVSMNKDEVVTVDEKTNPANHIKNPLNRILTKNHYVALHAGLLVWPMPLACDWSSGAIESITSIADPRNIGTAVMYVVLVVLGLTSLIGSLHKASRRLLAMSLALLVAPFIPASGLFVEVGYVVAERLLYSPSMGFCLAAALLLYLLYEKLNVPLRVLLSIALAVLLALFAVKSWTRNAEWVSEASLYESGLMVLPNNAKLHHNFAASISDQARKEFHFREAIRIYPPYASAYVNLGVTLAQTGREEEAVKTWQQGLRQWEQRPILGDDPAILNLNSGIGLKNLGRYPEALHHFEQCLRYQPHRTTCREWRDILRDHLKK